MRIVTWTIRLVVFVLLVAFGAKNADPVTLRFYFDLARADAADPGAVRRFRAGRVLRRAGAARHAVLRQRREICVRCERKAAAGRAGAADRDAADALSHGVRILVAARLSAVLRPGLDRRAHRHPPDRVRVARAAALVLQGPQLPAERAARQGDRGVHRGGEGRSRDDRAALRARQPVPPPRRVRPRDPHAPEPARARRTSAPSRS